MRYLILFSIILFFCAFTSNNIVVKGVIRDRSTSQPIIGAVIYSNGIVIAQTDVHGSFHYMTSPGDHALIIQTLGYIPIHREFTLLEGDREITLTDLFLDVDPVILDSVTVTASRITHVIGITPIAFGVRDFQAVPRFYEPDPLRSIQALPGISNGGSDLSAQITLRGGNADETLVALDGVQLYNPYHMGGMFGMISDDILQREDIYRSNYPVNYGGEASGVVDMVTKSDVLNTTRGSVGMSLSSMKGVVEAPAPGGTLMISARRFWMDLTKTFARVDIMDGYSFIDAYGKYILDLGRGHSLSLSHYASRDKYELYTDFDNYRNIAIPDPLHWDNQLTRLDWTWIKSTDLQVDATLYSTQSLTQVDASAFDQWQAQSVWMNVHNSIREYGAKVRADFSLSSMNVTAGGELRDLRLAYQWDFSANYNRVPGDDNWSMRLIPRPASFFDFAPSHFVYDTSTVLAAAYLNMQYPLTDALVVALGMRSTYIRTLDAVITVPYVGMRLALTPHLTLTAGVGRYHQYLYSIKDAKFENNIDSPYNAFFLARSQDEMLTSNHYALGMKVADLPLDLEGELETYYKDRQNIASSYQEESRHLVFERGYAEGIDILLRRSKGSITGWIAYSFMRSIKKNAEYDYFANPDRTHTVKAMMIAVPWRWLSLDCQFVASSGVPYTEIIGKYLGYNVQEGSGQWGNESLNVWNPIYGRKNTERTEAYSRLDLGMTFRFTAGKTVMKPFIQIFNMLDSPNPFGMVWMSSSSESEKQKGSAIIPNIGMTVEF